MITIYLNDKTIITNQRYSLSTFLSENGYQDNYFAVTVNRHFIPRADYPEKTLSHGDKVDIIMPMQGG